MAQRKTQVKGPSARYTNRNMPAQLLQDLRLAAVKLHRTMEEVCNDALKIGLKKLLKREQENAHDQDGGTKAAEA
jgi:plasmid stability protein